MEFVVYIFSGKHATTELVPFRCPRCGRIVFRHNSKHIEISNAYGAGLKELEAGQKDDNGLPAFTEHKCHSCKSIYKILFQ